MKIKLFTIPNLITLSNLLCGAGSIVASLVYEDLTMAFVLIMAAAVCDFFDGFAARVLKQPSEIGVQLDSLADMVSFGTAPAAAFYTLCGYFPSAVDDIWAGRLTETMRFIPFIITAFSALRLAKFNIDETQHTEFCGLPTPANALFFAALGWMNAETGFSLGVWVLLLMPVMSWLLISPVRMFAFKFRSFSFKGNEIRYLFIALSVVLLVALGVRAVPVIILLYIVVSAVKWIVTLKSRDSAACPEE